MKSPLSKHRAKRFQVGQVILVLSVLPWLAWVLWLGHNNPFDDPVAHHRWLMKINILFTAGVCISLVALIFLLFGNGLKRGLYAALASGLLLFYLASLLVGD
jgi:hypothetical protein